VFENRVLKRIFGPKGDEMTGDWRILRNEELHNMYSSFNIVGNEMGGTCSRHVKLEIHAAF
jgi:hypothetical protein